jgi:Enoyl-(Acyl carrier protein) reductase
MSDPNVKIGLTRSAGLAARYQQPALRAGSAMCVTRVRLPSALTMKCRCEARGGSGWLPRGGCLPARRAGSGRASGGWLPGNYGSGLGFFPSEMTAQYPDGYLDRMTRDRTLLARLGKPEELAATLVWLVSPASGYVTGQTIVVDGGVSIT